MVIHFIETLERGTIDLEPYWIKKRHFCAEKTDAKKLLSQFIIRQKLDPGFALTDKIFTINIRDKTALLKFLNTPF